MADWAITGSDYLISGTNGSVTAVRGYSQNGAFVAGDNMGWYRSGTTGAQCIRLTVTPTVRTKKVTFSFRHNNNTNGYTSAAGTYYIKASTTNSWPSYNSNDGTSFSLSSAGTKSVTVELDEATDSAFYVYLWAYYDSSGTYTARLVHVTKLSNLVVERSAPAVEVYDGDEMVTVDEVKAWDGEQWVDVEEASVYTGEDWADA